MSPAALWGWRGWDTGGYTAQRGTGGRLPTEGAPCGGGKQGTDKGVPCPAGVAQFSCPPISEKHLGLGTPGKSRLCKGMLPVQTSGEHKNPTADFRGNFPGKSQGRR